MAAVKTSVTELPESRVRVEAEVPAEEVERRLEQAARALGREMRVPGFRKGKVPAPLVVRRVGRDAVLDEAVRGALGGWYVDAIDAARIVPVGEPQLDLGELPGEGEPLTFSIEIGVRPAAVLGDYTGLEVGRREPEVQGERVDAELQALRDRLGTLETVDRAAGPGDFLVVDYAAQRDGEALTGGQGRDELVELGSGRLLPGFDERLTGAAVGDEREIVVDFPADHDAPGLAGTTATFAVTVKEVKAKRLPELDDELAADAAGFDSLEELREDIRSKLVAEEESAVETEFRQAALDAAVREARVDVPDALIAARAAELWEQTASALERQGIAKDAYLRVTGKREEEIVEEAKPDAEQALRREAVLAAIVEAEGIAPSDQDMMRALEHSAQHEGVTPRKLLERLRSAGRAEALREDLAQRQAVDVVAQAATPISVEQARARDKLWTPGKDEPAAVAGGPQPGRLWTPGG